MIDRTSAKRMIEIEYFFFFFEYDYLFVQVEVILRNENA